MRAKHGGKTTMAFCGKCGTALVEGHSFCAGCGAPVYNGTAGGRPPSSAAAAPAAEKTFYENNGVLITNARCVAFGETYAMSGVTSVAAFRTVPSKFGPIVLMIFGTVMFFGSFSQIPQTLLGLLVGPLIFAAGLAWFKSRKDIFTVKLHTAGAENTFVSSKDQAFADEVVAALNDVIVHRG